MHLSLVVAITVWTSRGAVFASDTALLKALYLATTEISPNWTMSFLEWSKVLGEFEIIYTDRLNWRRCKNILMQRSGAQWNQDIFGLDKQQYSIYTAKRKRATDQVALSTQSHFSAVDSFTEFFCRANSHNWINKFPMLSLLHQWDLYRKLAEPYLIIPLIHFEYPLLNSLEAVLFLHLHSYIHAIYLLH